MMGDKPIVRVLLVDDHAVVREGYRRLLERSAELQVVGECSTADAAVQQFAALCPDVVVMDIALPGASGIEALRRILQRDTSARVLVFSMYDDAIYVRRALQAGARGYVTKASAPQVLVEAVQAVSEGRRYLDQPVAQDLALSGGNEVVGNVESLSAREFEVLRLLVDGRSLREIADALHLTPKTVANHQSAIKQKLGATTSVQLLRLGAQWLQGRSPPPV